MGENDYNPLHKWGIKMEMYIEDLILEVLASDDDEMVRNVAILWDQIKENNIKVNAGQMHRILWLDFSSKFNQLNMPTFFHRDIVSNILDDFRFEDHETSIDEFESLESWLNNWDDEKIQKSLNDAVAEAILNYRELLAECENIEDVENRFIEEDVENYREILYTGRN